MEPTLTPVADVTSRPTQDLVKAQLDILLEEYRTATREISQRVEYQQRITNYQLIAMGLSATIGGSVLQSPDSEAARYYLLLAPFVFLLMSWTFSNHDFVIAAIRDYVEGPLRTRATALLGTSDVLGYEHFLTQRRREVPRTYGPLILFGQEFAVQLVIPPAAIVVYLAMFFYNDLWSTVSQGQLPSSRLVQWTLLLVNIVLYVSTMALRVRLAAAYFNLRPLSLVRELVRVLRK